jgi:hypothetical protein
MEFDRMLTAVRVDQDRGGRAGTPMIDLGRALDLLTTAVGQRRVVRLRHGPASVRPVQGSGGPQGLVGRCLSLAGANDRDLDALDGRALRELYRRGALPVQLTLGALVVFDAAQRGQDRGYGWDEALEYAVGVAERFLDLVPASTSREGGYRRPSGGVAVLVGPAQREQS